jgi:phospholipid/cholesterol/gamma-HCH transport system substrate-binding protein
MDSQTKQLSPDDGLPRALELKAALILVLLAAIIVGAVGYVMYARGVFEKSQTLMLVADDADGVSVGMDMTFAGFPIGRVTRVSLHDDGRARLEVEIPQREAKWLRQSSVFTLEKGLIGSPKLKAYTGLLEGPLLTDGSERPVLYGDASAQIPQITMAAKELLEHLSALTNNDSALAAALNNFRITSARLNSKHGALGVIMGNDKDAAAVASILVTANDLVKTLDGLVAAAGVMVGNADRQVFGATGLMPEVQASVSNLTQLLAQTRTSMLKVDDILAQTQGIASDVKGITADTKAATVDLVALRAELEGSLRKVDSLINEINSKWPLSRQVEIRLP